MPAIKEAFTKPITAGPPSFVDPAELKQLSNSIHQQIAVRAYRLFEESGYHHGNDQGHWFQAENDTLRRGLQVRDTGSWVIATGELPHTTPEKVEIYIDSRRLLVRATPDASRGGTRGHGNDDGGCDSEVFVVADLDTEVEATTASASLKDDKLTLMVKKRVPVNIGQIQFSTRR